MENISFDWDLLDGDGDNLGVIEQVTHVMGVLVDVRVIHTHEFEHGTDFERVRCWAINCISYLEDAVKEKSS